MKQMMQSLEVKEEKYVIEVGEKAPAKKTKKHNMKAVYVMILLVIAYICAMAIYIIMRIPSKEAVNKQKTDVVKTQTKEETVVETHNEEEYVEYDEISYSKIENYQRYDDYMKLNPELETEDVVWMVNANLDMPMYGYDIEVTDYYDPYIIVNKYYKVSKGYKPSDLVKTDGVLMRSETSDAYKKMRDDAKNNGLSMRVVSAYRSVEYQESLYNKYLKQDSQEVVDRSSARPGYSEHHTGMALDLFGSIEGLRNFEKTPEYTWLKENCYKYGFIIRYTEGAEHITGYMSEPWHIRYVGTEVSTDMKEKNIKTFEEYHVKYLQ